jgi:hypothetical protein
MSPDRIGPILVSLSCDRTATPSRGAALCAIEIKNTGGAALRLNKRLVIGYENIIDRDLYFDITKDGAPYVGTDEFETSSAAEELTLQHYRSVAPGEALTRKLDLAEYYRFKPGTYRIRAVYAPQPSEAGKDAWSGVARSNEIVLKVK